MAGTRTGGLKASSTNRAKYGENFYKNIGSKGGSVITDKPKGFAANPELARRVGARIGLRTRKGYKWIKDIDKRHGEYINLNTGEACVIEYSRDSE